MFADRFKGSLFFVAVLVAISGCAEPERAPPPLKAAPTGTAFAGSGRVSLHRGAPCTPQVMFDFKMRGSGKLVWLAARMRETKILTDAARENHSVHIQGTWQHGRERGCSYISVTRIEL